VGRSSLGRVLDPSALDACAGARARLRVDVPASWLAEGAVLRITAPPRLACARCDGGGCDACARSGALRPPAEAAARTVLASLSRVVTIDDAPRLPRAVVLRIPRPFGPEHDIHQLLIEVCVAEVSSSYVVRLGPAPGDVDDAAPAPLVRTPSPIPWPVWAVAVVATIVWVLFGR
jgi:hypothetical protein